MGNIILEQASWPTVSVARTGVVYLGYGNVIEVDSCDLLKELRDLVGSKNPSADCAGKFAARIEISVSFLGELKEE